MDNNKQIIAIAEYCGWKLLEIDFDYWKELS
jgi:hypothetical protein